MLLIKIILAMLLIKITENQPILLSFLVFPGLKQHLK